MTLHPIAPANATAATVSVPEEFTPAAIRMFIASVVAQLVGGTMAIGLFPLLMLPIMKNLGWSRTEMGGMGGASVLAGAIGLPLWGYWVDRFGARSVILCGTALTTLAFFALAALSGSLSQGFATFAFAGFVSATSVAQVKAQALHFNRYRGRVLAGLGMTLGVSFGLTPLAGKFVLDAYGWRLAYGLFGLLPLCVSLPLLFAWFRGEAATARQGSALSAVGLAISATLRRGRFWTIVCISAGSGFVFAGMQTHFVAFLQERGLSGQGAVNVLSISVLAGLLCQLLTGWLLDRWQSPRAGMPFVAVALMGMVLLWTDGGAGVTIAGAILFQSGVGGELSMFPYLVSRTFGTAHLARILGTVMLISQVISSGSPLMMGILHDRTGSYGLAPSVFAGLLAASLALLFKLGKSFREPEVE